MRIGVLTGGGDVPGLNPCIKAIVNRAEEAGHEVIGITRGWGGLLNFDLDRSDEENSECFRPLTRTSVRTIDRYGGTHLHTSRTNPGRVKPAMMPEFLEGKYEYDPKTGTADCTPHVLKVLERLGIDTLIPIGGDDTLSYGVRMHQEGVPVVAVPKTMDNDVYGTDYCIGFSTAVTRSVEAIHQLRTPTGSHERIAVVELFGRYSGETALISAYLADADRALISEVPFDIERVAELVVEDRRRNPSNYAMVVVSEGAKEQGGEMMLSGEEDAYGHRKLGGIGMVVAAKLKELTGIDTLSQNLGYMMRAGAPDSLDRMVGTTFGNIAVDQILAGKSGLMVALREGRYTTVSADTPAQGEKRVDVDSFYDKEGYRPRVNEVDGKPMFLY